MNGVIASGGGGMENNLAVAGKEQETVALSPSSLPPPPPPPLTTCSQQDNNNDGNDDDHLPWTIADLLNTPFSLEGLQQMLSLHHSNICYSPTLESISYRQHPNPSLISSS